MFYKPLHIDKTQTEYKKSERMQVKVCRNYARVKNHYKRTKWVLVNIMLVVLWRHCRWIQLLQSLAWKYYIINICPFPIVQCYHVHICQCSNLICIMLMVKNSSYVLINYTFIIRFSVKLLSMQISSNFIAVKLQENLIFANEAL